MSLEWPDLLIAHSTIGVTPETGLLIFVDFSILTWSFEVVLGRWSSSLWSSQTIAWSLNWTFCCPSKDLEILERSICISTLTGTSDSAASDSRPRKKPSLLPYLDWYPALSETMKRGFEGLEGSEIDRRDGYICEMQGCVSQCASLQVFLPFVVWRAPPKSEGKLATSVNTFSEVSEPFDISIGKPVPLYTVGCNLQRRTLHLRQSLWFWWNQ